MLWLHYVCDVLNRLRFNAIRCFAAIQPISAALVSARVSLTEGSWLLFRVLVFVSRFDRQLYFRSLWIAQIDHRAGGLHQG